ncbi:MAG: 50S ribosomal protein L18 [Chloroflexi bacterium]|nr:50S ribosomal protein L18 [Chloroflexota bacterium]
MRSLRYKGKAKNAWAKRKIRHIRVRKKVHGTEFRPRLCVFRSLNHMTAQIIDDNKGHTILAASDMDTLIKNDCVGKTKKEVANMVGTLIAQKAKNAGINEVVFDRGGYAYHGRVQALADGAREQGLVF